MDFADNRARAVLVTGIPFPPAKDLKVEQKKDYLDKMRLPQGVTRLTGNGHCPSGGGAREAAAAYGLTMMFVCCFEGMEWYKQQASRAVNQAVGRVVRHRNDYGAVILLDERFGGVSQQQGLSSWLRPWVKVFHDYEEAEGEVSSFCTHIMKDPKLNKGVRARVGAGVRGKSMRNKEDEGRALESVVVKGVEQDAVYVDPATIQQVGGGGGGGGVNCDS